MVGLSPVQLAQLAQVPRGNTQKHVSRDVLTHLLRHEAPRLARQGLRWLDAPCGAGELLGQLRRFFPQVALSGTDVHAEAPAVPGEPVAYVRAALSRGVPFAEAPPFEVITSISGIRCFANTAQFVAGCAEWLRPGGLLLIRREAGVGGQDVARTCSPRIVGREPQPHAPGPPRSCAA